MVELRLLRAAEHEANPSTIEECQAAGGEQQRQTEDVPVKSAGPIEVVHVDAIWPSREIPREGIAAVMAISLQERLLA